MIGCLLVSLGSCALMFRNELELLFGDAVTLTTRVRSARKRSPHRLAERSKDRYSNGSNTQVEEILFTEGTHHIDQGVKFRVAGSGGVTASPRGGGIRNRPDKEILVPDWLKTSHVTQITSSDWLFTCVGRLLYHKA
eukprot:sb/3474538/